MGIQVSARTDENDLKISQKLENNDKFWKKTTFVPM
jgi:hypothetical protein